MRREGREKERREGGKEGREGEREGERGGSRKKERAGNRKEQDEWTSRRHGEDDERGIEEVGREGGREGR